MILRAGFRAGRRATGVALAAVVLFGLGSGAPAERAQAQSLLIDPEALGLVLGDPQFSEGLTEALQGTDALKDPYVAPRHQVFQPMDEVSQQRGVHGRAVFVMDNGQRRSGLEIFVYDRPDAAASHMETLVVTPESRGADGSWNVTRFTVTHANFDHGIEAHCAVAPFAAGAQPRQIRCAHHRPGSQLAVAAYSYGTKVLDQNDAQELASASAALLLVADLLADAVEQDLRDSGNVIAATEPEPEQDTAPVAPDLKALGRALGKAEFRQRFENALGAAFTRDTAWSSIAPFQRFESGQFKPSSETERRESGIAGRGVYYMDGGKQQKGLELVIFDDPARAAEEMDGLSTAMENPEEFFLAVLAGRTLSQRNVSHELPCKFVVKLDGGSPTVLRCPHHRAGSRIVAVSFVNDLPPEQPEASDPVADAAAAVAYIGGKVATEIEQDLGPIAASETESAEPTEDSASRPSSDHFNPHSVALVYDLYNAFQRRKDLFAEKDNSLDPFEHPSLARELYPDPAGRRAGVQKRLRFPMSKEDGKAALELLIFEDASTVAAYLARTAGWPTSELPEGSELGIHTVELPGGDGKNVEVPCHWPLDESLESDLGVRCVFAPAGSRFAAIAHFKAYRSRAHIIAAAFVAFDSHQWFDFHATPPKDQPSLTRELMGTDYLGQVQARYDRRKDAGERLPGFGVPRPVLFDHVHDFEFLYGLGGRVVVPMADPVYLAGVELLEFIDRISLDEYLEETRSWPIISFDPDTSFERSSVTVRSDDGSTLDLPCYTPFYTEVRVEDLGIRCVYAPEGSLLVTAAYYTSVPSPEKTSAAAMMAYEAYQAAQAPSSGEPAKPATAKDVLMGEAYLQALRSDFTRLNTQAKSKGRSMQPFAPAGPADVIAPHREERRFGLEGRVRFAMANDPGPTGIDVMVFEEGRSPLDLLYATGGFTVPELPDDYGFQVEKVLVVQPEGPGVEIICAAAKDKSGRTVRDLGFRCIAGNADNRVAAVSYYPDDPENLNGHRLYDGAELAHLAHRAAIAALQGNGNQATPQTAFDPKDVIGPGTVIDCAAIVGEWRWFIGGMTTFAADGTAHWKASPQALGRTATWTCDPATGAYAVTWDQGPTDTLTLSADGASLEGQNDQGVTVSAARYDPAAEAAEAEALAALKVPPEMVGTWQLEIWLPTPQGPVPVAWTINADGSYVIDAAHLGHSGTMEARDGKWSLESQTNDWRDGGTMEFEGWTSFVATGVLGPGRWHRFEPRLRVENADMGGEPVPGNVPELVTSAYQVAGHWRPDAKLVGLELDHEKGDKRKPSIEMRFHAPKTGAGLVLFIQAGGTRFFEHSAADWGGRGIPDGFIGLTEAWAIARQHGLPPPLGRASLRVYQPKDADPVLAWSLSSQRGRTGITIDGATGAKLEGDLTGYVDAYNAQWQQAIAGLKQLFARPAPRPSSGSGYSCCDYDTSSGSSDSSSGSSSSSSSNDTAAQNAWGAGDMDAYHRIQNGTATWEDKSRFGY